MHSKLILKVVLFLASYAIAMPCYCEILQVPAEKLNELLARKSGNITVVDVRGGYEFEKSHIGVAINVPLAAVNTYGFAKKKTLVLYCGGIDCFLSGKAAKILTDRGYKDVRVLTGGLLAWERKGFPVIPPAPTVATTAIKAPGVVAKISAAELFKALPADYMVVDVRPNIEFGAGHIKSSPNIPLEGLPGNVHGSAKGRKLVVYDRLSARSAKAAGLLAENGFTVFELAGGLAVWAALGYPIEAGAGPVVK